MEKRLIFILFVLFWSLSNSTMAQPGFDDDVVDTPIDGGIAILIASGLVFGAKKIKKSSIETKHDL
jgi:hypothetical protein